jgi:hypothetical protein
MPGWSATFVTYDPEPEGPLMVGAPVSMAVEEEAEFDEPHPHLVAEPLSAARARCWGTPDRP